MTAPAKRVGDDPSVRRPEALDRALDRAGVVLDWLWRARGEDLHHLGGEEPALFVGNHSGGPLALFEPLRSSSIRAAIASLSARSAIATGSRSAIDAAT
jgi:hypothetical protein